MKTNSKIRPVVLTRSLLTLGFGCALTALPLASFAQEGAKASPPTTAGQVDTDQNKSTGERLHTDSTMPKKAATEKATDTLSAKEKQFMHKAAASNAAEVMMGQLALKNGESASVKEFAQQMVDDHKKANSDLSQIADAHGISNISPDPSDEDKAMYAQMTSLTGTAFDTMYIKHAAADHQMVLNNYKKAKGDVKDKQLLAYIDKTSDVIAGHLKMAQEMSKTKTSTVNH